MCNNDFMQYDKIQYIVLIFTTPDLKCIKM